jgi:hypothetical protein
MMLLMYPPIKINNKKREKEVWEASLYIQGSY